MDYYDMDASYESGDEHVASTPLVDGVESVESTTDQSINPTPERDGSDPGNDTSGSSSSSSSNSTSTVSANAADKSTESDNVQRTCIVMLQVSLRANARNLRPSLSENLDLLEVVFAWPPPSLLYVLCMEIDLPVTSLFVLESPQQIL